MKFEILDKFIEQKREHAQGFEKMAQREQEAAEKVNDLHAQYEKTMKESVQSGGDSTAKLDKIAEEIEKAQKQFERRQQERQAYSRMRDEKITSQDVVNAFNSEFLPAFKAEKVDPALERLLEAKKELVRATLDYYRVVDDFELEKQTVRWELGDHYQYQLKSVDFVYKTESDKYFLKDRDLYFLGQKQIPESIKYEMKEV